MGLESNASAFVDSGKIAVYSRSPILHEPHANYYYSNSYWLDTAAIHELAHQHHLSKTGGIPHTLNSIIGQRASTQQFLPDSLMEGIAVYEESLISPYSGRLNVGYFDALLLTKATENKLAPTLQDASVSSKSFPKGQWYVYGSGFIRYLKNKFGTDKVSRFITLYGEDTGALLNNAIFPKNGMDKIAEQTFGKSLSGLYLDWKTALKIRSSSWTLPENAIRKTPYTIYSPLVTDGSTLYYSALQTYYHNHFSYYNTYSIYAYSPNQKRHRLLVTDTTPYTGELHVLEGELFFMTQNKTQGYNNYLNDTTGVTHRIYRYNLASHDKKLLIQDEITAYEPLSKTRLIFTTARKEAYGSVVWTWDHTVGRQKKQTLPLEVGEFLKTPEGIFFIGKEKRGSWDIFFLDSSLTDVPIPVFSTPYIEKNMRLLSITPSRITLLVTSSQNQQFSPFILELDRSTFKRNTSKVSEYARFYPVQTDQAPSIMMGSVILNNRLYFSSLHSDGQSLHTTTVNSNVSTKSVSNQGYSKIGEPYRSPKETLLTETKEGPFSWPHTRLLPFLLKGESDDKREEYELAYSSETPFKGTLLSKRLSPIVLSSTLNYYASDNILLKWALSTNLFKQAGNGITGLTFYYENSLRKSPLQTQWRYFQETLGAYATYTIPAHNGFLQYEQELSSAASFSYLSHAITYRDTQFKLSVSMPNGLWTSITPRGRSLFEFKKGRYTTLELSRPLLSLNKGLWTPNLYAETIIGTLFYDSAAISQTFENNLFHFYQQPFYYYGVELSLSINAFYRIYFIPKVGISYSNNAPYSEYFSFSLSTYF